MSSVEVAYSIEGTGPPLYMVHGIGSRKPHGKLLLKICGLILPVFHLIYAGTERVLYRPSPIRWMNWLKTWRHSDNVWGMNEFMWSAIHSAVKSALPTPAHILNV